MHDHIETKVLAQFDEADPARTWMRLAVERYREFVEELSRFELGGHRHHHPLTAADQPATAEDRADRESDCKHNYCSVTETLDHDDSIDYHPYGTLKGVKSQATQ